MATQPNDVTTLREAYRRWHDSKGGSVDHWISLMTDDVDFRSLAGGAAPLQFTLASTNKQQTARYFAGLNAEWEMIYYRIDHYIADGERIVAVGEISFKHRLTGKTVVSAKADIHRFRDGKICEFFEFYDTAKAMAAATP